MKIKIIPLLIALVISLAIALVFWKIDCSRQYLYKSFVRQKVQVRAARIRANLENGVARRLALAEGLAAYASIHPKLNQREFESFAKSLLAADTVVRSMDLARDNRVSHIYPLAGNEKDVGVDIMRNNEQRDTAERAMVTRKPVVAGPVKLIQGGEAVIGKVPVFLAPSDISLEAGAYWGMASISINQNKLFHEAGVSDQEGNLQLAVRGKDGRGEKGAVFFGDEDLFIGRPVLLDVSLSNGSWRMAALPLGGWPETAPGSWKFRVFGIFISIIMGILSFFFIEAFFPKTRTKLGHANP